MNYTPDLPCSTSLKPRSLGARVRTPELSDWPWQLLTHSDQSTCFLRAPTSALGSAPTLKRREEVAFEHQRLARSTAATDHDLANALWGGFVSGLELERPDTGEILEELASLSSPAPSEAVRVAAGRLFLACRRGTGLHKDDFAASNIVERVDDPLVRLSFGHARGSALVFSGRYQEAIATIDRQIAELERYGLAFALPHSYLLKADGPSGSPTIRRSDAGPREGG